jgi:hypothetical protein
MLQSWQVMKAKRSWSSAVVLAGGRLETAHVGAHVPAVNW